MRIMMFQGIHYVGQFFFNNILNVSAINALAIFKSKHINKKISGINVLETVCRELIKPQIERRSANACLSRKLNSRAKVLLQNLP